MLFSINAVEIEKMVIQFEKNISLIEKHEKKHNV